MSSTYAASDAMQEQTPGLKDDAVSSGTDALNRAEDREVGLGSSPGITNKATTAMHQGMDQATGEQTTSTRAHTGVTTGDKGAGEQVKQKATEAFEYVTKNLK